MYNKITQQTISEKWTRTSSDERGEELSEGRMSDTELMKTFKFDEADQAANLAGRITKKQKARFIAEDKSRKKRGRVVGMLLLVIAALGPLFMAYAWIKYAGFISMTIVDLSTGAIWMLVWGIPGVYVLSRLFARPEFKIAKAEGHARIIDVQSSYANNRVGVHQELQIGGKRFMAAKGLAGVVPENEYIVYYLDRLVKKPSGITYPSAAEDILSIIMVEKEEANPPLQAVPEGEVKEGEGLKTKDGE